MKYLHKITQKELTANFDDLLEFSYANMYDPDEDGFISLNRNSQQDKVHHVYLKSFRDVVLLLDYLTTFDWHYEPEIKIHVGEMVFDMPRRGNSGHNLREGDLMILEKNDIFKLAVKS